jgi:hypothetical protein
MKLFISWSGPVSKSIATQFREWLPMLNQHIDPYMSEQDTEKGAHWSSEIRAKLEATDFGIVILTPENTSSIWLHFEAGAIAMSVAVGKLAPILFGLKQSEVLHPLALFQTTAFERDDMLRLARSINLANGEQARADRDLEGLFNYLWPELQRKVQPFLESLARVRPSAQTEVSETEKILQEILLLARQQTRLLSNPEELFGEQVLAMLARLLLDVEGGARRLTESERDLTLAICARWASIENLLLQALDGRPAAQQNVKWFSRYLTELQTRVAVARAEDAQRAKERRNPQDPASSRTE